jgi:uncharacterized protein involved in outer membrane biogenesis
MTARTRIGLIVLAVIVLAPIVSLALLVATFDPNRYKPQIVDAVKRATGRDLALNGPLSLKPSLWPTLEARDVALANIEGGSRPQMVTLGRLEAQVSLLPLLRRRLEIDRLVLLRPDILFEINAQGQPNWRFGPTVPSQSLPQPAPPNASKAGPLDITVKDVRIEDGTLTYRTSGPPKVLGVNRLEAEAAASDSPVHLAAQASYNGVPFALEGNVGPLSRLSEPDPVAPSSVAPWPVRLAFASSGAQLAVAGALAHPLQARGYSLKLDGHVANLAALQPFYPRGPLPPVQDLAIAAQVADRGDAIPDISALTLHAGASDLSSVVPGLSLTRLDIAAARMDQPVQASAEGTFAGAPLAAEARLGAPASLISGAAAGPFPVDVSAHAAGTSVAIKGGLADPVHLSGADLAVAATVPDLAALSPLARRLLPPLANIAFEGKIGDRDGGLLHGAVLHDGKLTLPQGDLSGTVGVGFAGRPSLQAVLTSDRIDLDGLSAALKSARPAAPSPPPAPPVAPASQPAPPVPVASPASPASPSAGAPSGRVIPDQPLPFDQLNLADADVQMRVGALTSGGIVYRDVAGRLALSKGRLAVDPFAAQLPGGRMEMKLTADASQPTPPVFVSVRAPGLALKPLLQALKLPDDALGTVEIDADLRGAGRTPHAIAAGLDGYLGIAAVNAQIDNRVIADTLGKVLRQSKLPPITDAAGQMQVRCFAARLDSSHGVANLRGFLLDTSLLHVEGGGSINLADETLALRLEPLARVGETGVMVPLRVSGTWHNPHASVDATGAAGEAARLAEGAAEKNRTLGVIIGALGGDRMIAGAGRDTCADQLALARGGRAGPLPSQPAPAAPASPQTSPTQAGKTPGVPKPMDLLRQFLR